MDKIEIIKGHDTSSYFWIMPIKIIDYSKPTNDIYNADEFRKEEISIEEEIVRVFLLEYLDRNFNDKLKENLNRKYMISGNIFEWNLEYNFYTIEAIKIIIDEINSDIKKIELNSYTKQERIDQMGKYLYFYLDKKDGKNMSDIFWKYKDIIIEFYNRFVSYMNDMIKAAKENGYELISFMGP